MPWAVMGILCVRQCVPSLLTEVSNLQTKKAQAGKGNREEDHHPPACRIANFPGKSSIWKNQVRFEIPSLACTFWNFGVRYVLTDLFGSCFVCTYVEPPDVFSSTHRKNSMVPGQGFAASRIVSMDLKLKHHCDCQLGGPHLVWHLRWPAFLIWLRLFLVEWGVRCLS